jgi:hypothetical protein
LQTKTFLEKNAKDKATAAGVSLTPQGHILSQLPAPGSKMSTQEFVEVVVIFVE